MGANISKCIKIRRRNKRKRQDPLGGSGGNIAVNLYDLHDDNNIYEEIPCPNQNDAYAYSRHNSVASRHHTSSSIDSAFSERTLTVESFDGFKTSLYRPSDHFRPPVSPTCDVLKDRRHDSVASNPYESYTSTRGRFSVTQVPEVGSHPHEQTCTVIAEQSSLDGLAFVGEDDDACGYDCSPSRDVELKCMASCLETKCVDLDLPFMVEAFQPLMEQTIIVRELLPHMDFICHEDFSPNDIQTEAVGRLLQAIRTSQEPGKWTTFLTALEKAEYAYIVHLLTGRTEDDHTVQRKLIKILKSTIMDRISADPIDFTDRLLAKEVITALDNEEIQRERINRGNTAAAFMLLERIPKRNPAWFALFQDVLNDAGLDDLAEMLNIYDDCDPTSNCEAPQESFCFAEKPHQQTRSHGQHQSCTGQAVELRGRTDRHINRRHTDNGLLRLFENSSSDYIHPIDDDSCLPPPLPRRNTEGSQLSKPSNLLNARTPMAHLTLPRDQPLSPLSRERTLSSMIEYRNMKKQKLTSDNDDRQVIGPSDAVQKGDIISPEIEALLEKKRELKTRLEREKIKDKLQKEIKQLQADLDKFTAGADSEARHDDVAGNLDGVSPEPIHPKNGEETAPVVLIDRANLPTQPHGTSSTNTENSSTDETTNQEDNIECSEYANITKANHENECGNEQHNNDGGNNNDDTVSPDNDNPSISSEMKYLCQILTEHKDDLTQFVNKELSEIKEMLANLSALGVPRVSGGMDYVDIPGLPTRLYDINPRPHEMMYNYIKGSPQTLFEHDSAISMAYLSMNSQY